MKKSPVVGLAALVVLLILFRLYEGWPVGNSSQVFDPRIRDTLWKLGLRAIESRDVPVSAVLLYGDSIIGSGWNTVLRDTNAGGHAEINAISDALRRMGRLRFGSLHRDSLLLVSTFEPCAMCQGAILEYNIRNVVYLKAKPALYLLKEDARAFRYLWERRKATAYALQESLFVRHPDYGKSNEN